MPGTISWSTDTSWAAWGGSRRYFSDVMSLAFNDMADALGLKGRYADKTVVQYRPGTLGNYSDASGNNRNGTTVGTVTRVDGGVLNTVSSGIIPGGSGADYVGLYDSQTVVADVPPPNGNMVDSFTAGVWFQWTGVMHDYYQVILGYYAVHLVDYGGGYIENDRSKEFFLALDYSRFYGGNVHFAMLIYDDWYTDFMPDVSVPNTFTVGEWYFLAFEVFFTKHFTGPNLGDVVFGMWTRMFLDGKLLQENDPSYYGYSPYPGYEWGFFPPDSCVPYFLNVSWRDQNDIAAGWGSTYVPTQYYSLLSAADEMFFAQSHLIFDNLGEPLITTAGSSGDQLFFPTRYPTPDVVGPDSPLFVTYGDVVDTGGASTSGFTQYQATYTLNTPVTGQHLDISVRSSTTNFSPDDQVPSWSTWYPVRNSGVSFPIGGGGSGRYSQVRLRIRPSSDIKALQAPQITEVQATWDAVANKEGHLDVPCQIYVGDYVDIPSQVVVIQTGVLDVPTVIFVHYTGDPLLIPAMVDVYYTVSNLLDIPAKVFVMGYLDIPSTFTIPVGSLDIPAQIVVTYSSFDIPAQVFVMASLWVPATISVVVFVIPARVLVTQPGLLNIPAKVTIPPTIPSAVYNLQATVPQATWQTNPLITFTWGTATEPIFGIEGYYWTISHRNNLLPQLSWHRNALFATTVDLSQLGYGSGRWYFIIAARSNAGFFGPVSVYEVDFDNPPSIPGIAFMNVNGYDTLFSAPIVPFGGISHFTWAAGSDIDPSDTITYRIEVATQTDFGTNSMTGLSSIVQTVENLPATNADLGNWPKSGRFFWRIQASDGIQPSGYSPVGAFTVNTPPLPPTGLTIVEVA